MSRFFSELLHVFVIVAATAAVAITWAAKEVFAVVAITAVAVVVALIKLIVYWNVVLPAEPVDITETKAEAVRVGHVAQVVAVPDGYAIGVAGAVFRLGLWLGHRHRPSVQC